MTFFYNSNMSRPYMYLDPHDPRNAKREAGYSNCVGHMMTHYHCGAMCHDCGWGGCGCFASHCCCPSEQESREEDPPAIIVVPSNTPPIAESAVLTKTRKKKEDNWTLVLSKKNRRIIKRHSL
jgi:hypothetical protein